MAVTAAFSPSVAKTFIEGFDYNGDGGLGLDEILVDRQSEKIAVSLGNVKVGALQSTLEQIKGLFNAALSRTLDRN